MKESLILIALFPLIAMPCSASISINVQVGQLMITPSIIVNDTSLWAIVYDVDNNGVLPGGLTPNSNLTVANYTNVMASFAGQTITTGATIGLDRILWAGAVDSLGTSGTTGVAGHNFSNFTFSSLGVAANGTWAIYWFPGLTTSSNVLPTTNFVVGGIQCTTPGAGGDLGMVFPTNDTSASSYTAAFIDTETNAGSIPQAALTAYIPESSTLTLSVLGLTVLLRRRRH